RGGVDVMIDPLPANTRKLYVLFGLGAGALFTGIVGTLATGFVWDIAHTDSTSPDLEVPKWIVYLCIPLGSYLMCFRFLQVAWSFWRTGELPHHDIAHVEGVDAPAAIPSLHPADLKSALSPPPGRPNAVITPPLGA